MRYPKMDPFDVLTDGRDLEFARAAADAIDLGALPEVPQDLVQADPNFLEDAPPAGNRDHVGPQSRIDAHEGPLDLARQNLGSGIEGLKALRNAHTLASALHRL